MQKQRFRPLGLQDFMVVAGVLSLLVMEFANFALDPGLGWHMKSGELMFHGHSFLTHDPFLASETLRPWITEQWLGSLILYVMYYAGSWPLGYGIVACLYLGTYFGILYAGLKRFGYLAAPLGVLFAFKIGQIHFLYRPVVFNFLFFTIAYVVSIKCWENFKKEEKLPREIFLMPFLFIIWANIHPAFTLGLFMLGCLLFSMFFSKIASRCRVTDILKDSRLLRTSIVLGLCFVAALVNPHGMKLYALILDATTSNIIPRLYDEWQPLNFSSPEGWFFELLILGVFGLTCFLKGRNKLSIFDIILMLSFGHLAVTSVRMLPFAGIVFSVPFVKSLSAIGNLEFFDLARPLRRLKLAGEVLEEREGRSWQGYPFLIAGILAVFLPALLQGRLLMYSGEYGPPADKYPYQALEKLNGLSKGTKPIVVLNDMDWGSFITLKGWPQVRAVIDDRTSVLGGEFYKEYFRAMKIGGNWQEYARKVNADFLLWEKKTDFARHLKSSSELEMVYEDDLAVIFKVNNE